MRDISIATLIDSSGYPERKIDLTRRAGRMQGTAVILASVTAIGLAAVLSALIIRISRRHWRALVRQGDLAAVQAAHSSPTPRLGGLAILAGLLAGSALAFPGENVLWLLLLGAVAPLFLSGAAEDLGFRVAPIGRLGAALLSSALAVLLTGAWIEETGVGGLDLLFAWAPVAVLITIVASSTISHAFNLIDGLNGLAGATGVLASAGIGLTALAVGDTEIATFALLLAAATGGFLILNYPSGRIFLGDAGAYSLGFLLAWMGIVLSARSPEVTPVAMVLILFWPLGDLALAIYRRRRLHLPVSYPDRLHFHQLTMRGIEICVLGRGRRATANPLATLVLLPLIALPVAIGVLVHAEPALAALALLGAFAVFFAIYAIGIWVSTRRTGAMQARQNSARRGAARSAHTRSPAAGGA